MISVIILGYINSYCQLVQPSFFAGALSVYSNKFVDAFSFTNNQASLASLKNTEAGLYNEKGFLLPALDRYMGAAGLITSRGNFGLKMNYAGFNAFNQLQMGLTHARKLGKDMEAGIQFNYNSIRVAGYGTASAASFEAGCIFHIAHALQAGIHVNNPVGGKFGKYRQEKIPSVYTMGLGYEASDLVFLGAEMIKEEDHPVNVNAGIYYQFIPQVIAKVGIATATSSLWMAIGFLRNVWRMELSACYHPQLGMSPGLLLLYRFNEPAIKD